VQCWGGWNGGGKRYPRKWNLEAGPQQALSVRGGGGGGEGARLSKEWSVSKGDVGLNLGHGGRRHGLSGKPKEKLREARHNREEERKEEEGMGIEEKKEKSGAAKRGCQRNDLQKEIVMH